MKRLMLMAALILCVAPSFALADGLIILPPHPDQRITPLAVKYHRVTALIEDQVAKTVIDQVFINPNRMQLEGTYIFPLPADAVVKKFTMFMNGKEVEGELLDKDKALETYQRIVASMKDPALLEYAGRGMFKARIFPIPAQGEVRTKITYTQVLKADGDLVNYVYQLNTEKFSSQPLRDVSVITTIKSKIPILNIYSPSHLVEIVRPNPNEAIVSFEATNVTPDRDFSLYYSLGKKDLGLSLVTYREGSEPGYYMMLISPGQKVKKIARKDLTLIIDTSGSMVQNADKLAQAKSAARFCLRNLNKGDRFSLIRFSGSVSAYAEAMVPATKENVDKAIVYLDSFKGIGGTDIGEALKQAYAVDRGKNAPAHMMIFLTDGQPTVGEVDPKKIVVLVKKQNKADGGALKARLFTFGVGYDVNAHLLDELAQISGGASSYVKPDEKIEVKVSHLYEKISAPILSDVTVTVGKTVKCSQVFPKQMPDLFKGSQLVLFGRYTGSGPVAITLTGKTADGPATFQYETTFSKTDTRAEDIPLLWAYAKISWLIDEIRLHGETLEVRQEVVRLSKEFGIITPYTSIIVMEDGKKNVPEARRTDLLSDNMKNSQFFGALKQREKTAKRERNALAGSMGPRAVSDAAQNNLRKGDLGRVGEKKAGVDKEADATLEDFDQLARKFQNRVSNRSFFLDKQNVWIEEDLTQEELAAAKEVKFLSEEYFKLLADHPDLGKLLAQGSQVTFRHEKLVLAVR